jgi:arylsulfatase A-like enzyme
VGRLLAHYAALGLAEDAIVVLTSDHGENLVEHDLYFRHGHHVWNSVMRVPLAIRWPGGEGRRIAKPVSLVDLTPTLLHHIGYPLPSGLDGLPLEQRGQEDYLSLESADWFKNETGHEYRQRRALVSGDRKWFASIDSKLQVGELHSLDLKQDPGELSPGSWKKGDAGRTLLTWFVDDPDPAGWPRSQLRGRKLEGPKVAPGRSEDELRALRALGYVE